MSREVEGRIRMVVSDDGTRCAAECPNRNNPADSLCLAFRTYGGAPTNIKRGRAPACIAAEVSTKEES